MVIQGRGGASAARQQGGAIATAGAQTAQGGAETDAEGRRGLGRRARWLFDAAAGLWGCRSGGSAQWVPSGGGGATPPSNAQRFKWVTHKHRRMWITATLQP